MKRDYQEVIDAMSNGEYTAEEIKSRIRSYLNNPASKIEGSFAMDSIQAVAQEMARAINMRIIDFIDMAMLDTAVYEFLDRKGLDYGLARNPATASNGYVKFTGAQGTIIPKGITVLSDTCTFTTDFEAIISSSGTTSVRATCTELGIAGNVLAGAITGIRATEGIDGVETFVEVQNDADKFAESVVKLYNDSDTLRHMSEESQAYIKEHNSIAAVWNIVKDDFS